MTTFLYTLATFAVLTVLWFVFRPKGRITKRTSGKLTDEELRETIKDQRQHLSDIRSKQIERPS